MRATKSQVLCQVFLLRVSGSVGRRTSLKKKIGTFRISKIKIKTYSLTSIQWSCFKSWGIRDNLGQQLGITAPDTFPIPVYPIFGTLLICQQLPSPAANPPGNGDFLGKTSYGQSLGLEAQINHGKLKKAWNLLLINWNSNFKKYELQYKCCNSTTTACNSHGL